VGCASLSLRPLSGRFAGVVSAADVWIFGDFNFCVAIHIHTGMVRYDKKDRSLAGRGKQSVSSKVVPKNIPVGAVVKGVAANHSLVSTNHCAFRSLRRYLGSSAQRTQYRSEDDERDDEDDESGDDESDGDDERETDESDESNRRRRL